MKFEETTACLRQMFSNLFSPEQVELLMSQVEILGDSNYKCYLANMKIIQERRLAVMDLDVISDMEWTARSVGEKRVQSKAKINAMISSFFEKAPSSIHSEAWVTDDVVYSVGEMIDRILIESIKQNYFATQAPDKISSSLELSRRVWNYLKSKLDEIKRKGFYECVNEQRTYDISSIEKGECFES